MKRVLIVEDDPVWAGILARYCQKEGFATTYARSPQEAMDQLDAGAIDVVLLDMLLAVETGVALLNELRGYDDLAQMPIIVCTSSPAVSLDMLAPFGVRALLDKATMEPADIGIALRGMVT